MAEEWRWIYDLLTFLGIVVAAMAVVVVVYLKYGGKGRSSRRH